jgi:hypothetical protein
LPLHPQSTLISSFVYLDSCDPIQLGVKLAEFWLSNLAFFKLVVTGQNFGDYELEAINHSKDYRDEISPFLQDNFNHEVDVKHYGFIKRCGDFSGTV